MIAFIKSLVPNPRTSTYEQGYLDGWNACVKLWNETAHARWAKEKENRK